MYDRRQLDKRKERVNSYFSTPGFARILSAIWRRYEGLGKVGGTATIARALPEECEAINTFMGWRERPGATIKVPLLQFERELLDSVFACTITKLHEWLIGEPLRTKSEKKLLSEQAWQHFFREIKQEEANLASVIQQWLTGLQGGSIEAGYRMVRELWIQSPKQAQSELLIALRAWRTLLLAVAENKPPTRLPVLAAQVSGNPHALDRSSYAGRLLFQALRFAQALRHSVRNNQSESVHGADIIREPDAAELDVIASEPQERSAVDSLRAREIYREAGVLDDDLSSLVHLFRPHDQASNEPYVLTLRQVEAIEELPAVSAFYVVENPAVFSTLVDDSRTGSAGSLSGITTDHTPSAQNHPLLVCTSGPASAAALRLFDRYMQRHDWKGKLYYSGDFDVKGIEIGNVLALRYADAFVPWRFDATSYCTGVADYRCVWGKQGIPFTEEEQLRLSVLQAEWDANLTSALLQHGQKLFQEQLVAKLVADWSRTAGTFEQ